MKKNTFFSSCNKFVKGAGLAVFLVALLIFSNGAYAGKKISLAAKADKSNTVNNSGNTAVGSDLGRRYAASGNPLLSNLTISAGVLQPAFNPQADTLNVAEASTVSSVTLTPTAYSSTAAITVNGTPVASGAASSPVSLNSGENDIYVAVTDSSSSFVYYIAVTKYPPVTISYSSPQTLYQGISAVLTPTTSGVGTFGLAASATVVTPSNYGATAVCLDAAGNVYFVTGASAFKIPAAGGPAINLASSFSGPRGVAVDASGVVYIADYGNNAVKKIPAGGGPPVTIGAGFSEPSDVAVDAAGDVYVADYGNGAVKEILAGNGQTVTVASGLNGPTGIAMDKTGNLYISDGALEEIPAGSTTVKVLTYSSFPAVNHIAIDKYGNFYLTSTGYIYLIPAASIYLLQGATRVPFLSVYIPNPYPPPTSNMATGIAVDASLNIYIAFPYSALSSFMLSGVYLPTTPLPPGLALNNTTGVISGAASTISPATNYTINAYGVAASSSATLNIKVVTPPAPTLSYSSPQTFYVDDKVTGLTPANSYVSAPAYNSAPTVFASGLTANAIYLAQDAQGNLYVSNSGSGIIQEVPAAGGPPVNVFTAASNKPVLAVDLAGDIFESDRKNIYKILKGSSTATLVASGFTSIVGMVVDPGGDIIVVTGANVEKILASDGSISTVVAVGGGDVALDGAGNLYVSEQYLIRKFPVGGGNEIDANLSFSSTLFSVDAAGDIFIGSGKTVYEIPANGGPSIVLGSSFTAPQGIVVDPSGTVYVADVSAIKQITPTGGYTITPALPAGVSLNNSTGVISGTPVTVSPAINYTITATNVTATATATLNLAVTLPPLPTISYASPQTYFYGGGPTTPPLVPTSTNVYPLHYSSTVTTVGSGFSAPTAVANDAAGNIYVADFGNNAVKKIPAGGGTPIVLGSGFSHPAGVALDAAGNVYVSDYGNDVVKKIPAGGGTPIIIGTGFSEPMGLAVDAAGNVFVADYGNNLVKKIPAGGGTPIILGSGFSHPFGLAVDLLGDIFIADSGNNAIKEIQVGSNTPGIFFTAPAPHGVAISPSDILYVVNTGANNVEMVPGTGVALTLTTIATGFNAPAGITIDRAGHVYIADKGNNAVKEIKPDGGFFISKPLPIGTYYSGLFLNSYTGVISGTPAALSPPQNYTVTGYNVSGSAAATLNIRVIAYPSLANLAVNVGKLSPVFDTYATSQSYSDAAGSAAAIKVTPTTNEPGLTITVNGVAVASGTASGPITLSPGTNTILVVVTASDGVTKQTYTITVGQGSNDAYLANLSLNGGTVALTPSFAFKTLYYTASVPNSTASITAKPSLLDATASVTVNGSPVANKTASGPIALAVGSNNVSIVVTAPNGVTTQTYWVTVTRAAAPAAHVTDAFQAISVSDPNLNLTLMGEDIKVHHGVSPNGDGIDDIFTIDNIANYPQNKLMIMDRNGLLIYQAKGYDNVTKAFDGHSNITGRMQLPGTYFYALNYTVNGVTKRQTGFIVLKD